MRISTSSRRRDGSAVIVVMVLLAIVLMYIAANLRSMNFLEREIKLVERQQLHRLHPQTVTTNTPPRP